MNRSDRAASPYGLTIRPLAPADLDSLAELPDGVSPRSAVSRFHGAVSRLSEPFLDDLLDLREGQREAVIAVDGQGIVGVARFARDAEDADTAEVAVLVADEWQHHASPRPYPPARCYVAHRRRAADAFRLHISPSRPNSTAVTPTASPPD